MTETLPSYTRCDVTWWEDGARCDQPKVHDGDHTYKEHRLDATLAAIDALHKQRIVSDWRCVECDDEWPCRTRRVLDGETEATK